MALGQYITDYLISSPSDPSGPPSVANSTQIAIHENTTSKHLWLWDPVGTLWTDIGPSSGGGFTPGGGLLAVHQYNPGTDAHYTTTNTTSADIDATNLAITFTAPSSGSVIVRLSGLTATNTVGTGNWWSVRNAGTDLLVWDTNEGTTDIFVSVSGVLTGLTPGTSYTLTWGGWVQANQAFLYYGSQDAPLVMEVWSTEPSSSRLALQSYESVTNVAISTNSTSFVDLDAVNLAITFVAPSSGAVRVHFEAFCYNAGGNDTTYVDLRESGADIANTLRIVQVSASNFGYFYHADWYITGLTPGTSHTYTLGGSTNNTGTTLDVWTGPGYGPAILAVYID